MRVLIVGAGAVGQVYGLALQRGGAEVAFYVKPQHAEEARAGFALYRLNRGKSPEPIRFDGFGVLTSIPEVRAQPWDQVWLAVSTPALRGSWFDEIAAATGNATVVCLQPGPEGQGRATQAAGNRVVTGIITFIAYQAPLPRETRIPSPGIAFWFPPGPSPFAGPDSGPNAGPNSGPNSRCRAVVDALIRGGCPAKAVREVDTSEIGRAHV